MKKRTPIPPLPSPVETAIKELMEEVNRRGSATIEGVIIHPSDLPTLGALITAKPLPKPDSRQASILAPGVMVVHPANVQTMVQVMTLEQQLEASLWALAEGVEPATNEAMDRHLPHLAGSTERVRRVQTDSVLILCPCKTALRFNRCTYVTYTDQTRCAEEVRVIEAGSAMCLAHR